MNHADAPVAVVTGAASGIGAAVLDELHARGWRVAGLDRAPVPDADLAVEVDVVDAGAMTEAVAHAADRLGPLRASVSCAGHYDITPFADIGVEQWRTMLRVHLGGAANLARAVLPHLVDDDDRSLVMVTSELAIGGGDGEAHYAAAKGAIVGLIRSLAVELAPRGVRVNGVAPGPTDTPMLAADSPWRAPDYLATLPTRALGTPQDVALCAAWLITDATYCTGEILHPNSGAVI